MGWEGSGQISLPWRQLKWLHKRWLRHRGLVSGMKSRVWKIFGSVKFWLTLNFTLFAGILVFEFSNVSKPLWWEDKAPLATSMLAGGLVSFFFYWLVVYEPERRKRNIIKSNFSEMYFRIKESILYEVVQASIKGGRKDLQADYATIRKLLTVKGFKEEFSGGREGHEGFYAFINQMSDNTPEFQAIILNLELLAKQIDFVLHNYAMDDGELFDFFKRLELILLSLRHSSPGYDESRRLCSFIYEIFSGWSTIYGYLDHALIDKRINEL